MHKRLRKYIAHLFLCIGIYTVAQQYPVKLNPVLMPPYSVRLADYATSSEEKVRLQVLLADLMQPSHKVNLHFSLESASSSTPIAATNPMFSGMQPFTIYPGTPLVLSNLDFRALFELQNLTGINAAQYSRPLPQGMYNFCFTAYDAVNNAQLSQKSCFPIYLQNYEPPFLTLPGNGEKVVKQNEFQNIIFQWMPRQEAPNTHYVFTLKEIWDTSINPSSAFLASRTLWQEKTPSKSFYYGIDKTALLEGKRYAWQVQAVSANQSTNGNIDPNDYSGVYQNNGLSEIFYFDYVRDCVAPIMLMAKNAGRGRAEIMWMMPNGQPQGLYNVQYRLRGSTADWAEQKSYGESTFLTGLADHTEYEYRVGSVCGEIQDYGNTTTNQNAYTYSQIQYFTTNSEDKDPTYQCGVMPPVDVTNKTPLTGALSPNQTFTAGDFTVTVIKSTGFEGNYSGEGFIVVPYLGDTQIKVVFNNIQVNSEKKLISGVVETTYDPNESAVSYASTGLGELFGDQGIGYKDVKYKIESVEVVSTPPPGKIIITSGGSTKGGVGAGGKEELPLGKDYEIVDEDGVIWYIDEKGNVTKGGKVAAGGPSTSQNTEGVSGSGKNATVAAYTAKGVNLSWDASDSKFAYDDATKADPKLQSQYPKVKDANGGNTYVSYKAVVNKANDSFDAKVTITDTNLADREIIFKTLESGKEIKSKIESGSQSTNDRTYRLNLEGAFSYATEQVIAVLMPKAKDSLSKQQVISSFNLVHLEPKTVDVSLVPLDQASSQDLDAQKKQLETIYGKVGVSFNVKKENVLDISSIASGDTIETPDDKALSTYSQMQTSINNLYKGTDARYVLFVTSKKSSTGQSGYMRLNGQFGYVYNNAPTKTSAHELGHGIFKLEHPWTKYNTTQSATDLLMDYGSGTILNHLDWKQINDPTLKLYTFQGQSAGEFSNLVITPDLRIVSITESTTVSLDSLEGIPEGTLPGYAILKSKKTNDKVVILDRKYFRWNIQEKYYENYKHEVFNESLLKFENSTSLDTPNTPKTITDLDGKSVSLFYNYSKCPGGTMVVSAAKAKELIQKNEIATYIYNNPNKGNPLNCVDLSNSVVEDKEYSNWVKEGNKGVPLDCYTNGAKEAVKNYLAEINKITPATSAEQINKVLKENYKECVFANIDINKRIIILNKLIDKNVDDALWEFSNGILSSGDKFYLDDLILSTPEKDKEVLLKDGFIKNNWIEIIFNTTTGFWNNDATTDELVPLFRALGAWVAQYYDKLGIKPTLATEFDLGPQGFSNFEYPVASVNPVYLGTHDDGSTEFNFIVEHEGKLYNPKINDKNDYAEPSVTLENNLVEFKQYLILIPHGDQIYETGKPPATPYRTTVLEVNYYEPVIMIASRNYLDLGIEANKEYTVPAFVAAAYQAAIIDKTTEQSVRSLGNGIAITAAIVTIPFSGGSSYVAYLTYAGGIVAGMDEAIKKERLNLNMTPGYAEKYGSYYDAWDVFYTTVGIADAGANVFNLASNLSKINLVRSTKNFFTKMKTFEYEGNLLNVWKTFNKIETSAAEISSLTSRIDNLKLTGLKSQFEIFDSTTKNRFFNTFGKASDDVLRELDDVTSFTDDYNAFAALWKNTADSELVVIASDVNKFKSWWYPNKSKIIDELSVNQKAFEGTLNQQFTDLDKLPSRVRGEAWNYYKQQKWSKLETLYKEYKINLQKTSQGDIIWPPSNGGYGVTKHGFKIGDKFDRYGAVLKVENDVPILTGNFTSPVDGAPYSFNQRALNLAENQYDVKYSIEIISKDMPFDAETSTIIPWFGQKGLGKQTKWNIPRQPNGYPKTLTQLAEEGYIKITIEKSPNGKYNKFVGKTIGGAVTEVKPSIDAIKNLKSVTPTGNNLTNLKKGEFIENGYKFKPTNGNLKSKIDDIIANGDNLGVKTEGIVDDIMTQNGYTKLDGKYGSNNGYDGVFIKGTIDNPSEIIIVESKQFKYVNGKAGEIIEHNGVTLNSPSDSTPLPAQMSDAWIEYVRSKLGQTGKTDIANMIRDYDNVIKKYVTAVDKTQGEINFLKLDNY